MNPFLGTIMWTGFSWPMEGWALCSGSVMSVEQNQALFSLIGTTFGGDGTEIFTLPDLSASTPIGVNYRSPSLPNVILGEQGDLPGGTGNPAVGTLGMTPLIAMEGLFPQRW